MNITEAIVLAVEKVKAWIQSGGVKWDHVSDKPFVKQGGDTLTWDGNTEGLEVFQGAYYKVSDAAPTMADLANGVTMTLHSNVLGIEISETISAENIGEEDGLIIFINSPESQSMPVVIVLADVHEEDFSLSKGTYFIGEPAEFIARSLTIPGYTGFAKEQIDPKVLPEALRFGKTTVQGDTLEWDGNTEGLVNFDVYFKVPDVAPSANDFANGCTATMSNGEAIPVDGVSNVQEGVIGDSNGLFMVVGEGLEFSAGLYFMNTGEFYVKSLTIPGYSGFTKTEVKTIEPEYLPGAVVLYVDEADYLCSDSAMSKRVTKTELQETLYSGRAMYLNANGMFFPAALVAFSDTYGMFSVFDGESNTVFYTAEYTA